MWVSAGGSHVLLCRRGSVGRPSAGLVCFSQSGARRHHRIPHSVRFDGRPEGGGIACAYISACEHVRTKRTKRTKSAPFLRTSLPAGSGRKHFCRCRRSNQLISVAGKLAGSDLLRDTGLRLWIPSLPIEVREKSDKRDKSPFCVPAWRFFAEALRP